MVGSFLAEKFEGDNYIAQWEHGTVPPSGRRGKC